MDNTEITFEALRKAKKTGYKGERTIIPDTEIIVEHIKNMANAFDLELTDNAVKIANAKKRFFGLQEWGRCPCDPKSDRGCISDRCMSEINTNGRCHCNLYKLKGR